LLFNRLLQQYLPLTDIAAFPSTHPMDAAQMLLDAIFEKLLMITPQGRRKANYRQYCSAISLQGKKRE